MDSKELVDRNKERFLEICRREINRDGIDSLIEWLLNTNFFQAPTSAKYHVVYAGGLVGHSLNVYDCLKRINSNHPEFKISDETIAICALFHNLSDVRFYNNEVYEVEVQFPIGHGEKSHIIKRFLNKLNVNERLAIRYHIGGFDPIVNDGDFGTSKAYCMSPLAVMLHLADMEATYLIESH